jgi:hypothetical protein
LFLSIHGDTRVGAHDGAVGATGTSVGVQRLGPRIALRIDLPREREHIERTGGPTHGAPFALFDLNHNRSFNLCHISSLFITGLEQRYEFPLKYITEFTFF